MVNEDVSKFPFPLTWCGSCPLTSCIFIFSLAFYS
jgi:hypothetical protein